MKEENIKEYSKKRKLYNMKLYSTKKLNAQKQYLRRHNITYTRRRDGCLYITEDDYNKLLVKNRNKSIKERIKLNYPKGFPYR